MAAVTPKSPSWAQAFENVGGKAVGAYKKVSIFDAKTGMLSMIFIAIVALVVLSLVSWKTTKPKTIVLYPQPRSQPHPHDSKDSHACSAGKWVLDGKFEFTPKGYVTQPQASASASEDRLCGVLSGSAGRAYTHNPLLTLFVEKYGKSSALGLAADGKTLSTIDPLEAPVPTWAMLPVLGHAGKHYLVHKESGRYVSLTWNRFSTSPALYKDAGVVPPNPLLVSRA